MNRLKSCVAQGPRPSDLEDVSAPGSGSSSALFFANFMNDSWRAGENLFSVTMFEILLSSFFLLLKSAYKGLELVFRFCFKTGSC